MNKKHIPLRMCTGCGEMKEKESLIRIVKSCSSEDSLVSIDLTGKKAGRGSYICKNINCLKAARKSRKLERTLSCKIPDEVYDQLEGELSLYEK